MTSAPPHLTEDDLEAFLMGTAGPELQSHCKNCAWCGERASAFTASLQTFNRATLAWSAARSNTITRDLSGHTPAWRLSMGTVRTLAATFVLGVVAAVTAGTYPRPAHGSGPALEAEARPAARSFAAETRAQEIARDNAMLEAIDAELTEPEAAPAALVQAAGDTETQSSRRQVRD